MNEEGVKRGGNKWKNSDSPANELNPLIAVY